MKVVIMAGLSAFMLFGTALGQQSSAQDASTTIRGCLQRSAQNDLLVESDGTSYALRGIGDKLDGEVGHWLEVKGVLVSNTNPKTAARAETERSNMSDPDNVAASKTLQVADVLSDVHRVADHCLSSSETPH
jgi:hypothetical protein